MSDRAVRVPGLALDYEDGILSSVGEDWHAMLYGNSDTKGMHQ